MPGDTEMPPKPAWLAGGKRGADEPLAAGAKSLKFGDKGKWKGKGKDRPNTDEHPGTEWYGQDNWQAGSDHWGWGGQEGGEWGAGEGEATEEPWCPKSFWGRKKMGRTIQGAPRPTPETESVLAEERQENKDCSRPRIRESWLTSKGSAT